VISIKQVEAFYWTARLGTVQKASMKLSITQSAATKRIQELERLAAAPLFQRQGTRLILSDHGRNLLVEAEGFLKALASLEELRTDRSQLNRRLRIGITELSALTWFPAFARATKTLYPDLALHPEVDLSAVLREKVLSGSLDAVVIQDFHLPDGIASIPIQKVDYAWFCKPGLITSERPVTLVEIARHPVIEQTSGSGLTALTRSMFAGMGIEVEHAFGSNSLAALAGLVEAGVGVACLPASYFRQAVRQKRMTRLKTSPAVPSASYQLAFLPNDQATLHAAVASIATKCASKFR